MAESALAGLHPRQRRHLRELGFEALRLRSTTQAAAPSGAAGARLHVSLPGGGAVPRDDARIRAIVRALGLTLDQIAEVAIPGVPSLSLPAPAELRRGPVKRELWPALRRLRRTLSESGFR